MTTIKLRLRSRFELVQEIVKLQAQVKRYEELLQAMCAKLEETEDSPMLRGQMIDSLSNNNWMEPN